MAKEMLRRKCSHCGHDGHNSRTCSRVVKLFGVRLLNPSDHGGIQMTKSVSTGNLLHYRSTQSEQGAEDGYLSDGLVHTCSKSPDRKKGIPWTEQEHRMFLVGLEKLGKGDWRGISRNFVPSRSPTQVASHAQKYFLRQSSLHKRRRRSSLFDMCSRITNSYLEENSKGFQPNASTSAFSVGGAPNYSSESMDTTCPQLLLPLWPGLELQSQTFSSNCRSNCGGAESMMESDEHLENLSLSIAPPSGDASFASPHLSHFENNAGFNRVFSDSTMIRVV